MNNLVLLKGDEAFPNSLIIAEGTDNEHESVITLIKTHKERLKKFGNICFSDFKSLKRGRPTKVYQLNEMQATLLIAFMDNTDIVADFKVELVCEFYAMRKFILERQTKEWQVTRSQGKITRKAETDILKQLIEYAKGQGSEHADKLYITYSKLANKIAGINKRDDATVIQLNNLSLAENIILHCIESGMMEGKHYKEIYQECKKRLEMFKDIAFLEDRAS